jgi:hypothetical protein
MDNPRAGKTRRVSERAPSWSWASIDGAIEPHMYGEYELNGSYVLTFPLEIQTYHDGDPFGQLKGGRVRLQGPIFTIDLRSTPRSVNYSNLSGPQPWTLGGGLDSPLVIGSEEISCDDVASIPETDGSRAYFLAVLARAYPLSLHGLVLKPTGLQRGQFRRHGLFRKAVHSGHPPHIPSPETAPPTLAEILAPAKDPKLLNEAHYEEADASKSFTIEII